MPTSPSSWPGPVLAGRSNWELKGLSSAIGGQAAFIQGQGCVLLRPQWPLSVAANGTSTFLAIVLRGRHGIWPVWHLAKDSLLIEGPRGVAG